MNSLIDSEIGYLGTSRHLSGNPVITRHNPDRQGFPVRAECAKRSYAFRALLGSSPPVTEEGSSQQ